MLSRQHLKSCACAVVGVAAAAGLLVWLARSGPAVRRTPRSLRPLGWEEVTAGDYRIELNVPDPEQGGVAVDVYRRGALVHQVTEPGGYFYLGCREGDTMYEGPEDPLLPSLRHSIPAGNAVRPGDSPSDLTGDGVPDLLIRHYSGGMHCCSTFYLLSLGPQVEEVAVLEAEHAAFCPFYNLDGDTTPEVVLADWTFAYWNASFAESPAPLVILKYRSGEYVVAPDLMRRPEPPAAELRAAASRLRSSFEEETRRVPPELWGALLDLIYSGNYRAARSLLRQSWPAGWQGREDFWLSFLDQAESSPWWPEVGGMNGLKVDPPEESEEGEGAEEPAGPATPRAGVSCLSRSTPFGSR